MQTGLERMCQIDEAFVGEEGYIIFEVIKFLTRE